MLISKINPNYNLNFAKKSKTKNHSVQTLPIHENYSGKNVPKNPVALPTGQILNNKGIIFNRYTTSFFRQDIDWVDFGKYLKEKFGTIEDVDIYCFACSSGQEAYSLAILLKEIFPDENFKIKALDISKNIINNNIEKQKNGVEVDFSTFLKSVSALETTSRELRKYFTPLPNGKLELSPEITDCVEFSCQNILDFNEDFNKDKKALILCRNMWPYVDPKRYSGFAKELYEKLPPESVVMIGSYDCVGEIGVDKSDGIHEALVNNNFKPNYRAIDLELNLSDKRKTYIHEK